VNTYTVSTESVATSVTLLSVIMTFIANLQCEMNILSVDESEMQ